MRAGSSLVIATQDGSFTPQFPLQFRKPTNGAWIPCVGRYVRVTGRLFDRAEMHAIAVERIDDVQEPNGKD